MATSLSRAGQNKSEHPVGNPPEMACETFSLHDDPLQAACTFLPEGRYTVGVGDVDVRHTESNADYHADENYRSCSRVKTLLDSPALYYKRYVAKTLPPLSSSALDHGTLLHRWLEEGDAFLETLVSPPASKLTATGMAGKEAEKWAKTDAPQGSTVLSPKELSQIRYEVDALKKNPAARELIEAGIAREVSIRWMTPNGHRVKCRADLITPDCWVDLKTTKVEDILADWWRAVLDFKYHLQCAWYMRGMEACGLDAVPLRFIVVSTSIPHDCQVVTLPQAVIDEGRRMMDTALADLRLREDLDYWLPDQHGEVSELQFPAYALRSMS